MKVCIKKAAEILGVSSRTLRRWEEQGKIKSDRTSGGHRRYDLAQFYPLHNKAMRKDDRITLCYARVSTHEQKEDLQRQVNMLESYSCNHGWEFVVVEDTGSGLNYHKRGLKKLLHQICSGQIERLVLTHKDRLLRFGSEIVFSLCEHFAVEVVIINSSENSSFEEELVTDVLEIITVFSARLYGSRSHKNRKIMENLKETANAICSENSP